MAHKRTPWEVRRDSIGNLYVGVAMEGYFVPIATVCPREVDMKQQENGYLLASSPVLYDACVAADAMLSEVRAVSETLSDYVESKIKKWDDDKSVPVEVMNFLVRLSTKFANMAEESKRVEQETTYAIEKANGVNDEIKRMSYQCPLL